MSYLLYLTQCVCDFIKPKIRLPFLLSWVDGGWVFRWWTRVVMDSVLELIKDLLILEEGLPLQIYSWDGLC
jgi:hypothetical protein